MADPGQPRAEIDGRPGSIACRYGSVSTCFCSSRSADSDKPDLLHKEVTVEDETEAMRARIEWLDAEVAAPPLRRRLARRRRVALHSVKEAYV